MHRLLHSRSVLTLLLVLLTAGVVFLLGGCQGGDAGHDMADHAHGEGDPEDHVHEAQDDHTHGEHGGHSLGDPAEDLPASMSETRSYTVRGEVKELPDPEDPLSGLYIRHEAIDGFVGMDGEVQGMDSMTMPFPAAEDLTFEGIEPGNKIEFTLEVNYDADPVFQVTEMFKLPDDTELVLRSARPPE